MAKKLVINITSADGVLINESSEQAIVNNINNWLNPLLDEFDKERAEIDLFVKAQNDYHISFSNISDDLDIKARAQLAKYRHLEKG